MNVGAWPTPAIVTSSRARAALGHRGVRLGRQQVGILAAHRQHRAADRVVERPKDGVARGGRLERDRERRIVVPHPRVAVAPHDDLGQEAPLGVAVRTERRGDAADERLGLVEGREARRVADVGADPRERGRAEHRSRVVQDHPARSASREAPRAPCRSTRPSTCRTSGPSPRRRARAASPCRRRRSAAGTATGREASRCGPGRRRRGTARDSRRPPHARTRRSRSRRGSGRARTPGPDRCPGRPIRGRPSGGARMARCTGRREDAERRCRSWVAELGEA